MPKSYDKEAVGKAISKAMRELRAVGIECLAVFYVGTDYDKVPIIGGIGNGQMISEDVCNRVVGMFHQDMVATGRLVSVEEGPYEEAN